MIKKSLVLFSLTSSLFTNLVYASDVPYIPPTTVKSITFGDPNNPIIKMYSAGSDSNGVKIDVAGKGTVYDSTIDSKNDDALSFLLNLNKNGKDDFVGLYDSKGPRGLIIGGKQYPSIFAALQDITISGFPKNDELNQLIRSIGRQVPDTQTEHISIQNNLQYLVEDSRVNTESIAVLQNRVNDLAKQITQQSKFSDVPSVLAPDTASTDVISFAAGEAVTDLIESRMDNSEAALGMASGDIMQSFGVWVRGMIGSAKQKEMKLIPEYKLNQQGITIGADIGEDDLIGVAFTTIASKVKQSSMTEKATNYIGSIYGLYNFTDNIFVNGQLKYGRSNIKKERNIRNTNKVTYGKTKGEMIGGKVELGYYYGFMDKSQLIPSVGLSYDTITIKKYKENNPNLLTRTVGKRTCDKTSFIVGVIVNHAIDYKTFILTPEIHTNINYVLRRKDDATSITLLEGTAPVYIPSGKPPKTSYKIGGSITASKSKNLEFSVGYDLGLSKKFHSHSGYIQARVDF
jgi:outer membrane autotransporter protein